MNSRRRRSQIVRLVIDNLCNNFGEDDAERYQRQDLPSDHEPKLKELDVNGKFLFDPSGAELRTLQTKGRNGNWRTKQLLVLALAFFEDSREEIQDCLYAYEGENETLLETHITLGKENFRMPSSEEITALDDELDSIVKRLPSIYMPQVAWNVYDHVEEDGEVSQNEELIDTVYYDASCERDYIYRSLVGHDGYNSSIILVP